MKLFARAIGHFYSVESKTSEQQLLEDFGEFPPTPLCCKSLKGEFKVFLVRGIGEIYYDLLRAKKVMNVLAWEPQLIEEGTRLLPQMQDLIIQVESWKTDGRHSKLKVRMSISFILIVGFLTSTTKAILAGGLPKPNVLGHFTPMYLKFDEIVIRVGLLQKLQKDEAPLLSHEHLHLLQFRNPEYQNLDKKTKAPENFLGVEGDLYLLEKKEVEARLHESVLAFYRAHRELPLTISGFLGLLVSGQNLGGYIKQNLELEGVTVVEFGEYPERDVTSANQLLYNLHDAKTVELRYKFITEVLPVMYGNLLKYYGDPVASKSFLEGIARPNLYDDLYSI